jgi:type II secretory pathway component GspD/PulD (secretin)
LNFRNAPIEQVLTYLSDAAGFIIMPEAPVRGNITVFSGQPMTKDEAVDLLNSVLNKNGYAAIRSGTRTLRILTTEDAKTSQIPVIVGNDPKEIPNNDEIVTQIIPVNFVEAAQLIKDLSLMTPPHATILANEAGNEIIITDTQANIRHLVEIIKAIDSSAETGTDIHVFKLKYHDPQEVADILTGLFSNQANSGSPITFNGGRGGNRGGGGRGGGGGGGRGGGFGGGPGGGFGGPGGFLAALTGANAGGNNQADRIKKRDQVIAQPDERTSSVIVMADKSLMEKIGAMIDELDVQSDKVPIVTTAHVKFGDAQQLAQELQYMFQTGNTARNASTANQDSALTLRQRQQQNATSTSGIGTFGSGGNRGGAGGTSF